jgi:hypothetical protein
MLIASAGRFIAAFRYCIEMTIASPRNTTPAVVVSP